ncbi:uncharacterized protein ColSpa_05315 [Colletotrichum spaethianum]|uniref:Glycosyl transferase CAP10 domain-containing protein n=1 Tax=Colletotrichum spaethianum TaxID=700344 RepID=A0AA37LEU2_9PEZI|nr:uncharacterized protein ColSpa_05315 [Colletotrichum spaethianum]GKT45134.1 hypothetical protein ColSpa_05315 [Colletotrichum spaethianum]
MRQRQAARRLWPIIVASTLGLIAYGGFCAQNRFRTQLAELPSKYVSAQPSKTGPSTVTKGNFNNLHLTEEQCQVTFPGLTKEIDVAVLEGEFQLGLGDISASLLGQITDNRILILQAPRPVDMSDQWLERNNIWKQWLTCIKRQNAALHQINRALSTSPAPLPDTFFNLYIQDTPVSRSWSHSRPAMSPSPRHIFTIPHFSFWAWNQPFIRSISHAAAAITDLEAGLPFDMKDRRAVWRGTTWFNNGASENPRSRQELLRITKDAQWADVQALEWVSNGENATNALRIEDFCRHKYIIHTEGVSYSGRLQFHQLCESVLLSPPIEWMQHTTHLIKPVYSSVLLGQHQKTNANGAATTKPQSGYPSARARETWPATVGPGEANAVFVNPDWSDLEATIGWLEDNAEVARGIARRQRALFFERGYLSPAAEVCYWRALIRGWSQVVRTNDAIQKNGGSVSFEEFVTKTEGVRERH